MSFLLPFLPALVSGLFAGGSKALEKKSKMSKLDVFSPKQSAFQNQLLDMLSSQLGQGSAFQGGQDYLKSILSDDPKAFEAFEKPFKTQFEQETIPMLAERFGGVGAQSSSGFQQALGQAGTGLSQNLAQLRAGLKSSAAGQAFSALTPFLGSAFQSPFAYQEKGGGGFLSNLLGGFGAGSASGLGNISSILALKKFLPNMFGGQVPTKTEPEK